MSAIPISPAKYPEAAVLPAPDSEVEALQADIAALVPKLWKFDGGTPLSDLLKIIARARSLGAEGFPLLKGFARRLHETRAFDDLYVLTSEMLSYGMSDENGDIERWEIQALIELGVYETALDFARRMMAWGAKTNKGREGYAAVGRIYKQMYVDGVTGKSREEPATLALYLERSFAAYMHVWRADKTPATAYHAVNALAIGSRAVLDGVSKENPSLNALADDILNILSHPANEDGWTWATRAEAFIALGRHQDAAQAYAAFAFAPEASLFQLHAAVRQLEQIWKLNGDDAAKGASVRVLKAAIIAKLGEGEARTSLDPKVARLPGREGEPGGSQLVEARPPRFEASQVNMSAKEAGLIGKEIAAAPHGASQMRGLQQVFENNAPLGLKALRNGLARARAVCRIHTSIGGEDKGFASGFAVVGKLLNEAWGDEPVIVTNNHVISSRPNRASQRAELCQAVFVSPETGEERRIGFARVLWESDIDAHDIVVLEPADELPEGAEPLNMLPRMGLPPRMTDDSGIGRVYVIGFPAAGELSFSFADNILLDHDAPEGCDVTAQADGSRRVSGVTADPVRMHYKAPTKEGSSGSPVFDFNDYALLGVHRRGLPDMPRLRGRDGAYAANEGVWVESIRAAIAESEASGDVESAPGTPTRWRAIASAAATMATPLKSAAIAVGGAVSAQAGKLRLITGMPGMSATGMSPVATQILRSGKASAEEVKAVGSESIVGLDDRTRIFDTNMAPWRMICAIRCYWGSRLSVGTGALIGPNILLTAGHVVFPRDKRSAPDEIEIIPALNGGQRPYGAMKATQIWIHPRWQESFELQNDVAAIELDTPVGNELGWLGLASRTPEELRFEWAHVTGYPGEKQEAPAAPGGRETAPVIAAQLWHHAAPVINVLNNRIFYAADTTPGQSGAPIYTYDPAQSPVPVVVGVHAYGKASTPVAVGNANSGAWIDPALFDLISCWRDEAAGAQ